MTEKNWNAVDNLQLVVNVKKRGQWSRCLPMYQDALKRSLSLKQLTPVENHCLSKLHKNSGICFFLKTISHTNKPFRVSSFKKNNTARKHDADLFTGPGVVLRFSYRDCSFSDEFGFIWFHAHEWTRYSVVGRTKGNLKLSCSLTSGAHVFFVKKRHHGGDTLSSKNTVLNGCFSRWPQTKKWCSRSFSET